MVACVGGEGGRVQVVLIFIVAFVTDASSE